MYSQTLVAIRLTRSRIGFAVFSDLKLEVVRCLNLPCSNLDDATKSMISTLSWMIEQFEEPVITVEQPENLSEMRRLADTAKEFAREKVLPFKEVPHDLLLKSYTFPPLKKRSQLRKITAGIFPSTGPSPKGEILDALALGLFFQTHSLLTSAKEH